MCMNESYQRRNYIFNYDDQLHKEVDEKEENSIRLKLEGKNKIINNLLVNFLLTTKKTVYCYLVRLKI